MKIASIGFFFGKFSQVSMQKFWASEISFFLIIHVCYLLQREVEKKKFSSIFSVFHSISLKINPVENGEKNAKYFFNNFKKFFFAEKNKKFNFSHQNWIRINYETPGKTSIRPDSLVIKNWILHRPKFRIWFFFWNF